MDGVRHPLNDVVDEREIPLEPAHSEYRNRFAFEYQSRKLMYRHVGPLGGSIRREEAKGMDVQAVCVMVVAADDLADSLGSGIRRYRMVDTIVFGEGKL